jgi:hypothetical protein
MSYWLCRVRIYHDALRQWLQSLRQVGFGLVVFFPMALPALVFLPLLSLGVVANPQSSTVVYLNTLWGYLLLLYSWMTMQRDGITATRYQLYLKTLPTASLLKLATQVGLIVYGAHFFILGPLLLLSVVLFEQQARLFISGSMTLWRELLPLVGMFGFAICYSLLALRKKIPWLSLGLFPFLAFGWAAEFSKPLWLLIWSGILLVEVWLPNVSLRLGGWPQGLYRLLLKADLHSPSAELLRLVALMLLIALTRSSVAAVKPDFALLLLDFISFLTAVLLGSSLFGAQAFRAQYQLYLATFPQNQAIQALHALGYVLAKTVVGVGLLLIAGIFSTSQWGLWLLCYAATLLGIWLKPKWFIGFPLIAVFTVVLWRVIV